MSWIYRKNCKLCRIVEEAKTYKINQITLQCKIDKHPIFFFSRFFFFFINPPRGRQSNFRKFYECISVHKKLSWTIFWQKNFKILNLLKMFELKISCLYRGEVYIHVLFRTDKISTDGSQSIVFACCVCDPSVGHILYSLQKYLQPLQI